MRQFPISVREEFLESLSKTHLFAPMRTSVSRRRRSSFWSDSIVQMLDVGYAFAPVAYGEKGVLFRGVASGVRDLVEQPAHSPIGEFIGDRDSSLMEQAFGIQFVSQDFSDALTVSGPFDGGIDNALLVFSGHHFAKEARRGCAASLAIGDFGHVFRYPFLTESLCGVEIELIFVAEALANHWRAQSGFAATHWIAERLIGLKGGSRADTEREIRRRLGEHHLSAASVDESLALKPRLSDLIDAADPD